MVAENARVSAGEALGGLYRFVYSNPLSYWDAFGLSGCSNDPDKCMKCMAWAEGRGGGNACMKAIAQVIWNRSQNENRNMCEIVENHKKFKAYRSSKNKGYDQCCNNNCPRGEKKKFDGYSNEADGYPEEFGGGDSQLGGADYFYSGSFPPSFGRPSDYQEMPVPGCPGMHFLKKIH